MEIELYRLSDNQKVIFDIDLNHTLDAEGGEGTIYKSTLNGYDYVIKPIELHSDTKKKYRKLIVRIESINGSDSLKTILKQRVLHSFIPYAQNFHEGKLFGYETITRLDVFAYSFVSGKKLSQHLSDNKEMELEERLDICIKLLDLISFMQKDCGILHADIFEDNFIIDSQGNLFPIDSTSCGYYNWNKDLKVVEHVYQARNRGKAENWGIPIPKDFSNDGITTQYTDRYFTVRLVWRILTNQMHPHSFLTRVDDTSLADFIGCISVDETQSWPAQFDREPKYIDRKRYGMYYSFMKSTFGTTSKIAEYFYKAFINGYQNSKNPSFEDLKK
ncbi:MAG: hypothetical protein IPN14_08275 [Bacteroidetes bacterium]|nr:hypothetical protein [Bacteroidota bacterium]